MTKKESKYVQKEFTKGSAAVIKYRNALKTVCEHLRYLALALIEQSAGNPEKLAHWNSQSTSQVILDAEKLLG